MTVIYTVSNQKGGVGKTSMVQNVGYEFSRMGHRTLLVDFDPQSNLTQGFGLQPDALTHTVYQSLITPEETPSHIVNLRDRLDILPADLNLAGAEREFSHTPFGRTTKLKTALSAVAQNYDYILIDSPPSLGFYTVNALIAAHRVLIPLQCQFYAYTMIAPVLTFVREASQENPALTVAAIIPTLYDARTSLAEGVVEAARRQYGDLVTQTVIPSNIRIADAPMHAKAVQEHDPNSTGAAAYIKLTEELLHRG